MKIKRYTVCNILKNAILLFTILFVICTNFTNPSESESSKNFILTIYSIYLLIIIFFWIVYVIIVVSTDTVSYAYKFLFVLGISIFFLNSFIEQQGMFERNGTLTMILNVLFFMLYATKHRDDLLFALTFGIVQAMLVFPYCEILWD